MKPRIVPKNKGFTLLELLIAISIFSLIMGVIYGSYQKTFKNIKGAENKVGSATKARVVFKLLTDDLQSVIPGGSGFLLAEEYSSDGFEGQIISFASTSNLVFGRNQTASEKTTISYSLLSNEDEKGFDLVRLDIPMLPGAEEKESDSDDSGEIVVKGVKEISLTFVTQEGEEEKSWKKYSAENNDKKQEDQQFPVVIKIAITFLATASDNRELTYRTAVALPFNI